MPTATVIPILRSFDEARTRAFYLDFLGFRVDWEHRFEADLPLYMQVSRGAIVLHLSEHHGDATPGSAVRILFEDLPALAEELKSRRHSNARPEIQLQPWGCAELQVIDPAGNRLVFYRLTEDQGED
ncbi:glyoxalase superfamily protein [Pseudomarimonas salicorniae]|uniref:Bleomycin resistance protein n=1 Tax=Pseudomarimonas salicorniae TaxID=2933270 RepID=A0ABT0GGJ4_9GAMM|nr:glyoxalase superfamily protein [Lysobacter sp. CAU 1642]MCK7593659.1 VOC family protein [Lysobacter sp. CAU 1642]